MKISFKRMADKWPSALVARSEISNFSGGILTRGYMANLDSLGEGPKGRVRVGRLIAYPVENVIEWLEERAQPCEK